MYYLSRNVKQSHSIPRFKFDFQNDLFGVRNLTIEEALSCLRKAFRQCVSNILSQLLCGMSVFFVDEVSDVIFVTSITSCLAGSPQCLSLEL